MSNVLGFSDAFGWHSEGELKGLSQKYFFEDGDKAKEKDDAIFTYLVLERFVNIIAYIPLIGSILGIVKLAAFASLAEGVEESSEDAQSYFKGMRVRAAIESLSLGALLIIPDVIATIGRKCQSAPSLATMESFKHI
ncbi:MAG: hypothetical protein S4CHLAM45_13630 [Chlamydiales bacterium]|nr:hypothetical protein [Chlamydiales bacterium]MCH9620467.1 hypothetical protein [Chlamydiales bacterium]MCH9623453.1 hypothetical protein [Chlamydiales bacterium]